MALVGDGRLLEPVAKDDFPSIKCRHDYFAYMLRARRQIQEQFARIAHFDVVRRHDHRADLFADARASGFPGDSVRNLFPQQAFRDARDLGALSASVNAFERYE
jgi:hypothetical protein